MRGWEKKNKLEEEHLGGENEMKLTERKITERRREKKMMCEDVESSQ